MLEKLSLPLLAVGAALVAIGLLWVMIVAFRSGFIKKAMLPVLVILVGAGVALAVPIYNRLNPTQVQTTAQVFGDSITITGATKDQLGVVMGHKGWKSIQAAKANDGPELTDDDLAGLDGMTELEFIDLNGQPVTDATLERLLKLPKLTKLYLARTKVSGETVQKRVLDNPECKLTEIDFRNLTPPVPGKAFREWQAKDTKARKFN
jgi:hypothetical protein